MTRRREIIIFAKCQPPCDITPTISRRFSDSQTRVSMFRCRLSHCLVDFSKNLARLSLFFILKSYWHMIFFYLESFENKLVD